MKMNRIILFLFFSIPSILLSGCCNAPTAPKPTELKVMAWNIWHGGHAKEYPVKGCEGTLVCLLCKAKGSLSFNTTAE